MAAEGEHSAGPGAPVEQADVVVVGGGIAGATLARLLSEAGHQVIVLDKARFPREKPCGEGVMPTGVRLLSQLGILGSIPAGQSRPIKGICFVTAKGAVARGTFPDLGGGFREGMGIRRLLLDDLVLQRARAQPGVQVHQGEAVLSVGRAPSGLALVSTARARYQARLVVGADGIHSVVRRHLGLDLPRGRARRYGMRAHFRLPPGSVQEDQVHVYLGDGGEAYTTPVADQELEVALLLEKDSMGAFAGQLQEAFERRVRSDPRLGPRLQGAELISEVAATGPFDCWPRCRVADRALLVGDAAGYLDPLTGEGISLALQGALWAAETIDAGLRRDDLSARALMPFHHRMAEAIRHYVVLTRSLLAIVRRPWLAERVAGRLGRAPEVYSKLLAINCGVQTFWDLRPGDLRRLLR